MIYYNFHKVQGQVVFETNLVELIHYVYVVKAMGNNLKRVLHPLKLKSSKSLSSKILLWLWLKLFFILMV